MTNRNPGNRNWEGLFGWLHRKPVNEYPNRKISYRHKTTGAIYFATTAEQVTRYDADPNMERI